MLQHALLLIAVYKRLLYTLYLYDLKLHQSGVMNLESSFSLVRVIRS